jgi:uncharacterized protein YaeQ
VAMALNAHGLQSLCQGDGTLGFGAGLSDPNDPDVFLRDFTGRMRLWVEVGQPEDKPVLKACGKADQMQVLCFGHAADLWWQGIQTRLARAHNLCVLRLPSQASRELAALAQRSMQLQATVQEGVLLLGDGVRTVQMEPLRLKS